MEFGNRTVWIRKIGIFTLAIHTSWSESVTLAAITENW